MGYIINMHTGEVLGDANQAAKDIGQPYTHPDGHYVDQQEIDLHEKLGE